MSAMIYDEPYKLPAGILALAVHSAFFLLLYFGIHWQAQPPQGMVVDIWNSLPEINPPAQVAPPQAAPVAPPPPVIKPVELPKRIEPLRPALPPKVDIALADKKKPPVKSSAPKLIEPAPPAMPPRENRAALEAQLAAMQAAQSAQAEQARIRAEQAALIGKIVNEHIAKIVAKIRRNIVLPPDVPDNALAEFDVTLLPGGSVLNAKLSKPSGDAAYDNAVERAILKAQPLPLPSDVALFGQFRELHLKFSPKE
ncbi:MAG: cell envelope integrity protein TolA [Gallionellaceae bacterium]|nr:cell envelope integrity protein TolA [Gallionellaceae bacterium]